MNQMFVSKLYDVLEENYRDENFGVKELASAVGVSRSQLHRKLHKIKGLSASQFIKLFRIEKAYDLLKNDASTVSEIAYEVGFSSPSYFSKCFADFYKCSPSDLKARKEDLSPFGNNHNNTRKFGLREIFHHKKWLGALAIMVLSLIILVFSLTPSGSVKTLNYSIAVLPIKNLSNDVSNQYFADGVMDVILSHLANVDGFDIISRTTMEQYREPNKTVPEIAKELDITHLLEASIQKDSNEVRIVVQLIDAKKDVHLWAADFERPLKDIFSLQSDIAKEISHQLQKELTPSEIQKMEEVPARNVEAYNMYLKGRFFWHRRKEEDLIKSINYFKQAIELDAKYALAYAGLGDAYYIMAVWGWMNKDEGYEKGKQYALKALSIDDKVAAAYATIGATAFWYEWDWDVAEFNLIKALDLEPNYATTYLYYALLLDILGRKAEARDYINKGLMLYPNSGIMFNISSIIYYNNHEYEKAVDHLKKSVEIREEPWHPYFIRNYLRMGKDDLALQHFKKALLPNVNRERQIDAIFNNSGFGGVLNHYADSVGFSVKGKYYNLAGLFCITGNNEKALYYLEKSYENCELHLPRMKNSIDFESIRQHPRFLNLLKEMKFD